MPKSHFVDLLELMQQEAKLYQEILQIQLEKKEVIIKNDLPALEIITKREQGFIQVIVQMEKQRTSLIEKLSVERNIGRIEHLSELMKVLNPFEQQQMQVQENKLKESIQKVQDVTYVNEKLIEQSLEFIEVTISIAQSLGVQDAGYGKNAEGKEVKVKKNLFDVKV